MIHGNTTERHIRFFIEYARFIAFSSLLFIHLTLALGSRPGFATLNWNMMIYRYIKQKHIQPNRILNFKHFKPYHLHQYINTSKIQILMDHLISFLRQQLSIGARVMSNFIIHWSCCCCQILFCYLFCKSRFVYNIVRKNWWYSTLHHWAHCSILTPQEALPVCWTKTPSPSKYVTFCICHDKHDEDLDCIFSIVL